MTGISRRGEGDGKMKEGFSRACALKERVKDGVLEVKLSADSDKLWFGLIPLSNVQQYLRQKKVSLSISLGVGYWFDGAFNFYSLSKSFKKGNVEPNTVVTAVLDMRKNKHTLHFLRGGDLLPHAIVGIPQEEMNTGFCSTSDEGSVVINVISVTKQSVPPPFPARKCIAYSYNGFKLLSWKLNTEQVLFEDGTVVPNVEEYFFV